jgi:hypothetical protein
MKNLPHLFILSCINYKISAMMKKITLLTLLVLGTLSSLQAQLSLEMEKVDSVVIGNAWVDGDLAGYAVVKNTSPLPVEVALRRIDGNYTELTDSNAICWGLCFTTDISQNPPAFNRTIQPGETDTAFLHVYPDLDGYTRTGDITYVLFDYYNPTDSVAFDITFQVNGIPLSQIELKEATVSVYPNPAQDFLRIQYDVNSSENAVFELINLVGAKVYAGNLDKSQTEIELDLKDFNPGVYFYTLKVDGQSITSKKLVIK